MSVGEGKGTTSVMIRCRKILPAGGMGTVQKVAIINRVGVFIAKKPGFDWFLNLSGLQILKVLGIPPVHALGGWVTGTAGEPAKHVVHRDATETHRPSRGLLGRA